MPPSYQSDQIGIFNEYVHNFVDQNNTNLEICQDQIQYQTHKMTNQQSSFGLSEKLAKQLYNMILPITRI